MNIMQKYAKIMHKYKVFQFFSLHKPKSCYNAIHT